MKYYQMHEQVYKDLQDKGYISWDKETTFEAMWSHQINDYLKKFLDHQSISFSQLKTLDLGCGSGTCALFCAKEGAQSLGVDISKTAIEMAQKNNSDLELDAKFIESDILNLNLDKKFDLLTDSSLLHCLVGAEDRTKFYKVVKAHLVDSSFFFMHTMIESNDMSSLLENKYFKLKDEVLYSLGIAGIENGRVELDGKSYFPHRTILKKANLMKEIEKAGFRIICSSIIPYPTQTDNFVALLKLK